MLLPIVCLAIVVIGVIAWRRYKSQCVFADDMVIEIITSNGVETRRIQSVDHCRHTLTLAPPETNEKNPAPKSC